MEPLLALKGIDKSFMGTSALAGVDFDLCQGEIHALMGENGAGKSTLIKTMTGVHPQDAGSIQLDGKEIRPHSPADAVRLGISTVYQEVNLVPNLSVMENLVLGREPRSLAGINWREARRRAESAIARLGIDLDVRSPLSGISIALQQMVAIARALDVSAKVLILDEPTSSLDSEEVETLFGVMRKLRHEGMGIIFITHFLDQVYAVSDRITVLRNGRKVGCWKTADLSRLELVTQMIGRDASALEREQGGAKEVSASAKTLLRGTDLTRRGSVSGVNLELKEGETLGFAGLLGSGRTETAKLLFGIDSLDSGELMVDEEKVSHQKPLKAIKNDIGYCSEDRKREGIFPELTMRENMMVLQQVKNGWLKRIPMAAQRAKSKELVDRLHIHPPDIEKPIQFLSGGNQQKALLARWLAVEPRVLILDEPTRGIDVGAKFEIMSLMETMRQAGSSFIFISSELPEVVRSCTKVMVMRDRKAVKTLPAEEVSEETIVKEIAG
jgi:monosaccharide-transporting ATPase